MIDYPTLRIIWWVLLGVLLIGFSILDGFDFGVLLLLPCIGKSEEERQALIDIIGPVWESNQVWFVLGGGAIFAAWPLVYAAAFSTYYLIFMLILAGFIIRPAALKYRSKLKNSHWRRTWDRLLVFSAALPSFLFGILIGNILQGTAFNFDNDLRLIDDSTFSSFFNGFSLLSGLLSAMMFSLQGSLYTALKTDTPLMTRAVRIAKISSVCTLALFIIEGVWLKFGINGYIIPHALNHAVPSNPLNKEVVQTVGGWLHNYSRYPSMLLMPLMAIVCLIVTFLCSHKHALKIAFTLSSISIAAIIITVGFSMYPFLLPSSIAPNHSLTIWDASSSQRTLFMMLIVTLFFMPIILGYVAWLYRIFRRSSGNNT